MSEKVSRGRVAVFIVFAALVVLGGVALYAVLGGRAGSSTPSGPAAGSFDGSVELPGDSLTESLPPISRDGIVSTSFEDVVLSPRARVLAERFKCVCGCDDLLSVCTCTQTPGSRDMKAYLQQLVNEGKNPGEVEAAMVARYGQSVIP